MVLSLNRSTINSYFNDYSILSFVENNLPSLKGKVLDIGCGKMKYKGLIESANEATKYIGLDLEEGKFSYSVKADLYWDGKRIPLENDSVDAILLLEVIEHCLDQRALMDEAFRVLKKGGVILVSTPFLYQIHGSPFDYFRVTPFGMEALMSSAGFRSIQIKASGGWDASLGQAVGIWINHRPMPGMIRKIICLLFVPIFKILLWTDKKNSDKRCRDGSMMPGSLGKAYK